MALTEAQIAQNKAAAKQCMLKADQYIKELHFSEAKAEIHKAKALDPSNMYINAFIDRINYFEEQKKAEIAKKKDALDAEKKKPDIAHADIKIPEEKTKVTEPTKSIPDSVKHTPSSTVQIPKTITPQPVQPAIQKVEKQISEVKPPVQPVQPKPTSVHQTAPKVEKSVVDVKQPVKPIQPTQQPEPASVQTEIPKAEKPVMEVKPVVKPIQPPLQPKPSPVQPSVEKGEKQVTEIKPPVKPIQTPQQQKVVPVQPAAPKSEKPVTDVKPPVKPIQPTQQPKPVPIVQPAVPQAEKPVAEVKSPVKSAQSTPPSKPVAPQPVVAKVEQEIASSAKKESSTEQQSPPAVQPVTPPPKINVLESDSKLKDVQPKKSAEEQLLELLGETSREIPQTEVSVKHSEPVVEQVIPTTPQVAKMPDRSAIPSVAQPQKPTDSSKHSPGKHVPVPSLSIHDTAVEKDITTHQLEEMKKQIEKLSAALEQEKKAREEMHRNTVHDILPKFRSLLEDAWIDGAPSDAKKTELQQLARTMSIPEVLFFSMQREVKIEMYGRAAKEIIAKRQVVRHSSSTLDWLRKVYQISMEEYVEYESKFLLDLVAEQYKGVVFQISSDDRTKNELMPKLKSNGFAVITSPNPEDALEKIEKLNPNVIICESSFGPGSISGIKFLHILRTNSKYNFVPFIFLGSSDDIPLLTAAELKPNEGFIQKPVEFEDLSSMINAKFLWLKDYVMSLSQ